MSRRNEGVTWQQSELLFKNFSMLFLLCRNITYYSRNNIILHSRNNILLCSILSVWIFYILQINRYTYAFFHLGFQKWSCWSIKCNSWNCSGLLDHLRFAYGQKCVSSGSWFGALPCHFMWWWVFARSLKILLIRYYVLIKILGL